MMEDRKVVKRELGKKGGLDLAGEAHEEDLLEPTQSEIAGKTEADLSAYRLPVWEI